MLPDATRKTTRRPRLGPMSGDLYLNKHLDGLKRKSIEQNKIIWSLNENMPKLLESEGSIKRAFKQQSNKHKYSVLSA